MLTRLVLSDGILKSYCAALLIILLKGLAG